MTWGRWEKPCLLKNSHCSDFTLNFPEQPFENEQQQLKCPNISTETAGWPPRWTEASRDPKSLNIGWSWAAGEGAGGATRAGTQQSSEWVLLGGGERGRAGVENPWLCI